jgi:hypothetical protein
LALGHLQEARKFFTTCSLSYELLEDGQRLRPKYVGTLINKQKMPCSRLVLNVIYVKWLQGKCTTKNLKLCFFINYEIEEMEK